MPWPRPLLTAPRYVPHYPLPPLRAVHFVLPIASHCVLLIAPHSSPPIAHCPLCVQVGAERYNIFTGCPQARTATIVLRGGSEQVRCLSKWAGRKQHDFLRSACAFHDKAPRMFTENSIKCGRTKGVMWGMGCCQGSFDQVS